MHIKDLLVADLITRLKAKTTYVDNCWLFTYNTENTNNQHYTISINNKSLGIHRVSASLFLGLDLDDCTLQANHKIECPNRNCWNPDHLYVGTHSDNMKDAAKLGILGSQNRKAKTHCNKGHLLEGVYQYNIRSNRQGAQRFCLQCRKESRLKSYHKNKHKS